MPKDFRIQGKLIRTLAKAGRVSVLTNLDAETFEVRQQVRGLPVIHRMFLAPEGCSLGYTSRLAGSGPTLHFIGPDLRLNASLTLHDVCSSLTCGLQGWIVACRDGSLYCFEQDGSWLWNWRVSPASRFEFPILRVAAVGDLVFVAHGLHLYALTSGGRLLWERELPVKDAWTRAGLKLIGTSDRALHTLGLQRSATEDEITRAYRRMARVTHPDLHPEDPSAASRFRAVRDAYKALQNKASRRSEGTDWLRVLFGQGSSPVLCSLSVNESFVAAGTSEGAVCLCDHQGKVLQNHTGLGAQGVTSVVLNESGVQAAFCYPHLFRFDAGCATSSVDIREYIVQLDRCADYSLLCGWDQAWLFGRDARLKASVKLARKIDRAAVFGSEAVILSGGFLYGFGLRCDEKNEPIH